jgi:hypothetical protein
MSILPEKRGFYERSLSVITADLPREKRAKKVLRALESFSGQRKYGCSLIQWRFRRKTAKTFELAAAFPLHPKFTTHRAKWAD